MTKFQKVLLITGVVAATYKIGEVLGTHNCMLKILKHNPEIDHVTFRSKNGDVVMYRRKIVKKTEKEN